MKAASPVLNGGDEETGFVRPRLVATQLECEHPTSYNEDRKWSLMNLSHLTEVFETALVHIKIGVTMEVSESAARFSRQKLRIMALCRKRSCTWPLRINTPDLPRPGIPGGPLLYATVVSQLRSVLGVDHRHAGPQGAQRPHTVERICRRQGESTTLREGAPAAAVE